jgi:ABC-2 type transport system ATP-binding protein
MTHELAIHDLVFRYPRRREPVLAIDAWSAQSGVHFLVGPNGSGKSTLMKLLAGLLRARTGEIRFDDQELPSDGRGRQSIAPTGYLSQDYSLQGRTTVGAYAEYGAWMHGLPPAELRARSRAALASIGLEGTDQERVGKLSGGTQRRVGLAVESLHEPTLMLLDEPTSGFDNVARSMTHLVIDQLVERAAVVIIASHEETEISRLTGTVHVIMGGRITQSVHHTGGAQISLASLFGQSGLT